MPEIRFSWAVTDIEVNKLYFAIAFENPIEISNSQYSKHSIKVKILDEFAFTSKERVALDPQYRELSLIKPIAR